MRIASIGIFVVVATMDRISVYVCVCVYMYFVYFLRTSVKNGLYTSHEDEVFHRGIATFWLGVSA